MIAQWTSWQAKEDVYRQAQAQHIPSFPLTGIPQIKPPFLDIAPAGIPPNIMPHSKGVKCGLMRPDSLKVPAFIEEETWKTFTMENPEITTEW